MSILEMESLIAKQALKIDSLQDQNNLLEAKIEQALACMVHIGGPLNDNKLQFTPEQLKLFQAVYFELMI